MGFRLSVQPILPVDKATLIYGSNDGGLSYKTTDEEAKGIMERIGAHLFLKPHICKDSKMREHTLVGPGDIEIHRGGDEKIYVIDAARLMPPDLNREKPNSIFYQSFRPEFLRWYKKPLSSDSYSNFGSVDGDTHNREALEASRVLKERVYKFASTLKDAEEKKLNLKWISAEMKYRGINAR